MSETAQLPKSPAALAIGEYIDKQNARIAKEVMAWSNLEAHKDVAEVIRILSAAGVESYSKSLIISASAEPGYEATYRITQVVTPREMSNLISWLCLAENIRATRHGLSHWDEGNVQDRRIF